MAEGEKKYNTVLGTFAEDENRPGVYYADEIDRSHLIVPAEVSNTGKARDIDVSPSTVFISKENGERSKLYDWALRSETSKDPNFSNRGVAYANNLSLIASFANVSGAPYEIQKLDSDALKQPPVDTLGPVRLALKSSDPGIGPFALVTNNNGGGIVNLTITNNAELLAKFTGVPSLENLNVPPAYVEAFGSFVAGHEVKHLHSNRAPGQVYESWQTYIAEVQGDHGTLKSYFNRDYAEFVMDMRALSSLNAIGTEDDHATQIWTEEYETGVMPTKTEAEEIMAAPELINENLEGALEDDIITSMKANPAERYILLEMARRQGEFDDIAKENKYVGEYLDKYKAAAERRYPQEDIATARDKFINSITDSQAYEAEPDAELSEEDVAKKLQEDPAYRYGNLKVLREMGAFKDIPGGNERVDRALAEIETKNPEIVKNIDMAPYRERYKSDEPSVETPSVRPLAPAASPAPMAL